MEGVSGRVYASISVPGKRPRCWKLRFANSSLACTGIASWLMIVRKVPVIRGFDLRIPGLRRSARKMVINLNNWLIALGMVTGSYWLGFFTVWNGPFSWNQELAARWPISNVQWGLHFPLLGMVLVTPFVAAACLLVTDRKPKVGFGLLLLGCLLNNGWIFLSLGIHD